MDEPLHPLPGVDAVRALKGLPPKVNLKECTPMADKPDLKVVGQPEKRGRNELRRELGLSPTNEE
jgi:hypothetical protein